MIEYYSCQERSILWPFMSLLMILCDHIRPGIILTLITAAHVKNQTPDSDNSSITLMFIAGNCRTILTVNMRGKVLMEDFITSNITK